MSFEKCCNFYPNNFKFCAVKKNYKYCNDIARKYGNVADKDFRKYEKLEYKKNKLKFSDIIFRFAVYCFNQHFE